MMHHQKEGWAIVIIIAVGAGFLVYTAAHAIGQVLALQTNANNPATAAIDTSGWLDYHNSQYNFDFEYPPNWQLSTSGLANLAPFVAVGNPLNGTKTYIVEVFIENNTSSLSSGEFVHQMLASDRAEDSANKAATSAGGVGSPQLTPQYTGTEILSVGQPTAPGTIAPYEAYELEGVYEFDHNADQIYVADGDIILRFDFPVAEENPNISLPVANNALAQGIVGTLSFQ
jgi:hypothetical protein